MARLGDDFKLGRYTNRLRVRPSLLALGVSRVVCESVQHHRKSYTALLCSSTPASLNLTPVPAPLLCEDVHSVVCCNRT
jgi:hypothetical protein